ncbi:Calcium-transporting ATPase 1 [Enhygromyxa salina]|uniref:Calcium-transporting ATPase 1 n=1 Tax=Enhygromyxa salina TaxID=215803 RepID=A0A2S9YK24_9BACT|nr:Calcium-transporting ATPase 1 [Enhygromyxa salina]
MRQFESPLVLILLAAVVISAAVGDLTDAVAITVIVALNAIIGFAQERRAERAMAALRAMTAPRATLRRGGELLAVPAREVVVGDVLVLQAGDVVAADARVLTSNALATNEAALTGESLPVAKQRREGPEAGDLAERRGSVFMGTAIAGGTGEAVVEAIGMATELGQIAELLVEDSDDSTPLQRRLATVSRMLLVVCVVLVACVAGLGALRGMGWEELLMASVSMAVAAVPEGLLAIITIALALGMQRMAARQVLVRRLAAVETLGSVTVICTDKTGTLTTGIMSVRELWTPEGEASEHALLYGAAACCDAELGAASSGPGDDEAETEAGTGDTTELAILRAARARGIEQAEIDRERPRLAEAPFSPERRRMSVTRGSADPASSSAPTLWIKGAVEVIAERLHDRERAAPELLARAEDMAARGLRVLAVAIGEGEDEQELELLGLIGLADPPRELARQAIAGARAAGVRTVMITGDHPVTAAAIARELGLIDASTPAEDREGLVRARTTAAHKTEIVKELREAGEVVAMTGDGVNDAPAIRAADVGLAMGKTATEVTREASDIVLTDDDLSKVLDAIREGRVIYQNIKKAVVYLLSGNFSELVIMLVAAAMGMPFPLLPLHLLWINLVTEPLPGLALVVDPPDDDVLRSPPRDPDEPLLGGREWSIIVATALVQTVVGFGVYYWALELDGRPLVEARSLAFTTVVCSELLRSFAFRSPRRLLWQIGALRNLGLAAVVGVSLVLQLALFQLPLTRELFGLGVLSWAEIGVVVAISFIPVSVLELSKVVAQVIRWARAR